MTSSPYLISLRDAARQRLQFVETHGLADGVGFTHRVSVALPVSYPQKKRQHYPLVLLVEACDVFGAAVEMSRLMAQTKENRESILVCVDTAQDVSVESFAAFVREKLLPWLAAQYRVQETLYTFSGRSGAGEALAQAVGGNKLLPLSAPAGSLSEAERIPALLHGLRKLLGTGHEYGSEITVMRKPLMAALMSLVRPFAALVYKVPPAAANPYRMHSARLARDFEIFAAVPPTAASAPQRRYPALFVLDACIEYSTVAEIAARLAASGATEELVVIGIGVPRNEGTVEFGFRRFEEYCPPHDGYRYDDELGRIFRSLFALRGQDARQCMGRGADFMGFITEELLPVLAQQLPIDVQDLGILGHSAGGTFVGYALSQPQSPFKHYLGISPGIGIGAGWLLRGPQAQRQAARAESVYLCIGGDEQTNLFNRIAGIPETDKFSELVSARSTVRVKYECFEGETHSSVFPRAAAQALLSTYPRQG